MTPLDEEGRQRAEQIAVTLWQGDLLATSVAVTLEAPASSLLEDAHELEPVDSDGLWAPAPLEIASGWTAIVTQTCDVVRGIDQIAHLQLMPVVSLSEKEWNEALDGRRGTLFSLPAADGLGIDFPAIDCAICFPVSKAALGHDEIKTLGTPLDPASRILLSHWLMRRVGRHAFPDDLEQHVLGPLREKISKSMGKTSQAGLLADALVGVWSSTEWAAGASIYFIVDENRVSSRGVDVDADKAVEELLRPVRKQLGSAGLSVQVTGTARTFEAVSAHDLMVSHRQVDLDPLPTGSFAAHDAIAALPAETAAPQPS
ncbi:MAG TPA: hypothetical protein VNV44_06750 [Solirubrobacteraceae bacterium]|nr:hypothetical protein [Solirubrobacteraceae bacterium]